MARTGRSRFLLPVLLGLALLPAAAAADDRCRLLDSGDYPVLEGCRQVAPGKLEISATTLSSLAFDKDGLASLYAAGQFYYLRRDGHYLPVITFDNGADYFIEGLTRAVIDGKLGYHDTSLQPAFPARFDWGWPFENGSAQVCEGCRPGEPDINDHIPMVGGRHFRIDRQGNQLPGQP